MNLIPNIKPKVFSFSAVVVGYLLIDDLTAREQNALGNWLMLVAQVISTNAFYKQVMQERGLDNSNTSDSNKNTNTSLNENENTSFNNQDILVMLEKMIRALEMEVEDLKNDRK